MFVTKHLHGRRSLWCALALAVIGPVQFASAQAREVSSPTLTFASFQDNGTRMHLGTPVNLNVQDVPLDAALQRLVKAGAPLVYPTALVSGRKRVTCRCTKTTLEDALITLLQGTNIGFREVASTGQIALIAIPLNIEAPRAAPGSVRGRVLDRSSGGPLPGVAVVVVGTDRGSLTDQNGRYFIVNVQPGKYLVVASRIGMRPDSQHVDVTDGVTVDANFALGFDPITMNPLEATVETGNLSATERKKIANSMTVITAQDIQISGARDLPELLRGRAPGVEVERTSGANGTGGTIQIRGAGSILLEQTPLIYVDGVPVDAGNGAINQRGTGANVLGTGAPDKATGNQLRIDELALGQIDHIEIIKGAAATTLYGTQGARGVIQIFTKRGVPGQTRFTASMEQGTAKLRRGADFGLDVAYADQFFRQFREPRNQEYQLGLQGGSGDISYSLGAQYAKDDGYVPLNAESRSSITTSFRILPSQKVSIAMSGTFTRRSFQLASLFLGSNRTTLETKLDTTTRTNTNVDRVYGSVAINYQPLSYWQNRLTLGLDDNSEVNDRVGLGNGSPIGLFTRDHITRDFRRTSGNFVSTFSYPNTGPITSTLSVGGEAYHDQTDRLRLRGQGYPNISVTDFDLATTITGGDAQTIPTDLTTKVAQLGGFLQEQVGFHDRLYVTAGLRADGNSTFGDNFGIQAYPKLGASYVFQPMTWWNAKLRSAWGKSGAAPPPFAKDLTYLLGRPAAGPQLGVPIETLADLGNPNLRPEINTEWEIGVENYFFGNRASLELNYFRQNTKDAQIRAPVPLSTGLLAGPLTNLAELRSEGIEAAIRVTAFDKKAATLDIGFTLTHMINNGLVTKLATDPVLTRFNQGFDAANIEGLRIGYSVRDLYYTSVFDDTATAGYTGREIILVGSRVPTTFGGASFNLRFLQGMRLYWNLIYNYGGYGLDSQRFASDLALGYVGIPLGTGYSLTSGLPRQFQDRYVFRTDQLKLDVIRLIYELPSNIVSGFGRNAEIWFESNNTLAWDAYPRGDPEGVPVDASASGVTGVRGVLPPRPVMYKVGVRMTF